MPFVGQRLLQAVVLDFDGVILDSETPEYESYRLIYQRCGVALTVEAWMDQVGVWADDQVQGWHKRLCELSAMAPELNAFEAEKQRLFGELVPVEPMEGIECLLDALEQAAIPVAIASASPARWVIPAATRLGLATRVRAIVTAEDVKQRKPAPDVYLEAVRRLGAVPARCVAIEDSGPGVTAARAAGLKTVAIPHPLTERHDLSAAHLRLSSAAHLTLDTLHGLIEMDGR